MKTLLVLIVVWSFSLQGITSTDISDGSPLGVGEVKRLLLNDPDVVGARLAELDRASQEMKTQMAQVQSQLSEEKTRNNNLMSTITQMDRSHQGMKNQIAVYNNTLASMVLSTQELKNQMTIMTNTVAQVHIQLAQEKTKNGNLQSSFDREKAKIVNLETVTSQMSASIQKVSDYGSTFTRWGRKQCSGTDTELIYTGFTAGQNHEEGDSYSTRYGGASNLMCLPNNPEMSNKSAPGWSYLYGTEYQQTFFGSGALDEDVPCALCRSKHTYSSVMIPGRKSCYPGWKIEYYGYLASNSYAYKASSFICVDASPEFVQGGKANQDGNLLYGTGTKCGSLPCPPYDDNFAVLCVVCSK